ncbi:MAG TPA: glutathione S-transferase family protein [Azospirillaceae bacterium]|nr:glutathione S-transferase family protein [Azospirillaceae bacterium]
MEATYRLYDNLSSGNGYKCRLMMSLLGIPFERVEIDIDRGESRTAGFLAINPNGRIPVLQVAPDRYLAESNAILCFLADGTPYMPTDPWLRAQVMQWLFWEQYSHEPNVATARFWITHKFEMTPERVHALVLKREQGNAALKLMDERLAGRRFLVDDRYTVADLALYAYTHVAEEGGFQLDRYDNVRAWLDRVAARDGHIAITDEVGLKPIDGGAP